MPGCNIGLIVGDKHESLRQVYRTRQLGPAPAEHVANFAAASPESPLDD